MIHLVIPGASTPKPMKFKESVKWAQNYVPKQLTEIGQRQLYLVSRNEFYIHQSFFEKIDKFEELNLQAAGESIYFNTA